MNKGLYILHCVAFMLLLSCLETVAQDKTPVALDDRYSTGINDTLIVSEPGVLGNDFDKHGGPLNAVLMNFSSNGSVKLNTDGSFIYIPDPGFRGRDRFTYEANDGSTHSHAATVTIYIDTDTIVTEDNVVEKVMPVPIASADSITAEEDQTYHSPAPGILSNDGDPKDGPDPLTVGLVSDVSHGSLSLHGNGSFEYTPGKNFFDTDRFTYRPYNGICYGIETVVEIRVNNINDPPEVINEVFSTCLNTSVTGNLLANDCDPDEDTVKITSVTEAPTHQGGTITIDSRGSFTYSPPEDFTGSDEYHYEVSDNGSPSLISSGTVYISVTRPMDLNSKLTHNTCQGGNSGAIDLAVTDSTPGNQTLSFNGTQDDVIIPRNAALNMTGPITLEAWIRVTGTAVNDWQVMGNDEHCHLRYENQKLIFYAAGTELIDTIKIMDDAWYHLAATYNRDTMKLYVNGAEVAQKPSNTAIRNDGSGIFHIGRDKSGKRHFEGRMDEVRVWSIARTEEQIRNHMIRELKGNEAGLEAYWKFNEGSGFTAYDSSPNGNDGSLSLPAWVNEYSYSWNGPNALSSSQEDINNLKAGEYTCTVTGGNGCPAQITHTITEPQPLKLKEAYNAHQNITCHGKDNGQFKADALGGSGSYEFSIDSGSTWVNDSVFTALSAGDYTVYLRNANDTACQYTGMQPIRLTQPSPFNDCDSLRKNNYCYRFWDNSYNQVDSFPVRYEWWFSDGTRLNGLEVEHCFPGEGKYSVKLNIIDNRTGNVFFTQQQPTWNCRENGRSQS